MAMIQIKRAASVLAAAALLAACGGGGGGGSAPPPVGGTTPTPTPTPTPSASPTPVAGTCGAPGVTATVQADASAVVGRAAGATLLSCQGSVSDIQWSQTGGPAVSILSGTMQAISFEPPSAGTYTFSVSYKDSAGAAKTDTASITAAAAPATSSITARLDQSVRGGSDVSIRAWPQLAAGDTASAVTWAQVSGPQVTLNTSTTDPTLAQFVAPTVTADTLYKFRVSLTTTAGTSATDEVSVVVQTAAQAPKGDEYFFDGVKISNVHAYKRTSKYAPVLVGCVYNPQLYARTTADLNVCKFSTLPLIGMEHGPLPTVAQIMDRVVVSHDWMGKNFEDFLTTQDANGDFRRLLASVTAVVLGSHVRPSFFYSATGAIYLDGDNLWLTPEQRDTVNEAPDFRSGFGAELNYSMPARFVSGNNFAQLFFSPTRRVPRDLAYLLNDLGDLMYHELGHANDSYPTSIRAGLTANDDPLLVAFNRRNAKATVSDILATQLPLASAEMRGLAQVNFGDPTKITDVQKAYTPDQVAGFFKTDGASDQYNYYTIFEDVAMLYEEFMMAHRHSVRRDVMVADKITASTTGANLIVRWGQRGRVADPAVKPRIKLVLQELAPWIDPAAVDALPVPIAMCAGQSYTQNLTLPCTPTATGLQKTDLALEYAATNSMAVAMRDAAQRRAAQAIQERGMKVLSTR
ncbi:MAG: PKD domain-containing protein [Burkholderiaceae bacterium]